MSEDEQAPWDPSFDLEAELVRCLEGEAELDLEAEPVQPAPASSSSSSSSSARQPVDLPQEELRDEATLGELLRQVQRRPQPQTAHPMFKLALRKDGTRCLLKYDSKLHVLSMHCLDKNHGPLCRLN